MISDYNEMENVPFNHHLLGHPDVTLLWIGLFGFSQPFKIKKMWYCGDGGLVVLLTPFFGFGENRRFHLFQNETTTYIALWCNKPVPDNYICYQTILTPNTSAPFIHSLYVTRANVDENSQDSLDWSRLVSLPFTRQITDGSKSNDIPY